LAERVLPGGYVSGLVGGCPFSKSGFRWRVYIRMTFGWYSAVADGAEWRGKLLLARETAVGASVGADLSAEGCSLLAESLSKIMQKNRHVNNFNGFTADRNGISLNH
jgi:hypothetical protein